MELRRVPAGVDEHTHRGAQNFVRLLNGSKVLAAVNNFALDPDGGVASCVPFHMIEGLYARLVENAADVATADIQFGHSRLDIDILLEACVTRYETRLSQRLESLERHFIRGDRDGDGSLTLLEFRAILKSSEVPS